MQRSIAMGYVSCMQVKYVKKRGFTHPRFWAPHNPYLLHAGFHGPLLGWNYTGTPVQLLGTRKLHLRDGSTMMYKSAPARVDDAVTSINE